MSRVTVLGAGFGALTAIRTLRRLDPALEIDVIAPQPRFVFYPATIWIPTGVAAPEQFEIPLERFFTRMHVTFHPGRATALEDGGRLTCIDDGQHNRRIENDGLIIATGSAFRRDVPGLEHAFLPCGGVAEMTRLRERLNELEHGMLAFGLGDNPDEPAAVRAGPLFELLFGAERISASCCLRPPTRRAASSEHAPWSACWPRCARAASRSGSTSAPGVSSRDALLPTATNSMPMCACSCPA